MIVLDLDRTLLRSDKTISDYTIRVLKECKRIGIKIVIASARPRRAVKIFSQQIGCEDIICLNGAMVTINEKIIDVKKIDKNTPIIFLTARNLREDILKGYQIGADDYITKPFDTELLLYKIKAILQRSAVLENEDQEQFKISNIFFDSMLRQLRVNENDYKLSPKENELLKLLCIHRNDFMPRDLALRKIWKKENYFTARSMDVYIAKLRKLLKDDDGLEIINVHGEGFRLLVKNPQ
ncbi:MAG TPA: hypothetical protein DC000_05710 [Clostridiales bacterium]|nr:hypothetical protein [Clostridiales bacterium]